VVTTAELFEAITRGASGALAWALAAVVTGGGARAERGCDGGELTRRGG